MEFSTKSLPFERCNLNAQIWDVSGKERGTKKNTQFYRDAVGAILVYDITNKQSFENIKNVWLKQIQEFGHSNMSVMLIGNKLDKKAQRQVSSEEAMDFAKLNQLIGFVEASALNGECVNVGFRRVIFQVGSILPSVKVHLDQLGLPLGWRIAKTEHKPVDDLSVNSTTAVELESPNPGSSDGHAIAQRSVDMDKNMNMRSSSLRKKRNSIHTYTNYWTDELSMTLPTMPAQHHLLYVRMPLPSPPSTASSPRGSASELKPLNIEMSSTGRSSSPGPSDNTDIPIKDGGTRCCIIS